MFKLHTEHRGTIDGSTIGLCPTAGPRRSGSSPSTTGERPDPTHLAKEDDMSRKDEIVALNRKKKVLVVACAGSALSGIGCLISSLRGSFEATIVAMLAVLAAAATGNWVHWAFKDANRLSDRSRLIPAAGRSS
jgi:hypothetical protein